MTAGSRVATTGVGEPPLSPTASVPPAPAGTNNAEPPPDWITRSCGSIRMVPAGPFAAPTSMAPVSARPPDPETSTVPPAPPFGPPRAMRVPAAVVCLDDITRTMPPCPWRVALADTREPGAIPVTAAVMPAAWPIATCPPPVVPEAEIRAAAAMLTVPVAAISMAPPVVPVARMRPLTTTEPPMD